MPISKHKAALYRKKSIQLLKDNFIGIKFGYITIIDILPYRPNAIAIVWGRCECGIEREYILSNLKTKSTTSCGCHRGDKTIARCQTHGLSDHPLFSIWMGIKTRCYNETDHSYPNYGAKGIVMSDEWLNSFYKFYTWCINNGWVKGMQIDRFPNKYGNYSADNCRIATIKQNANNKTTNRIVEVNGESLTISEICDKYNVDYNLVFKRIQKGWDINIAISTTSKKWRYLERLKAVK